MISIPGRIPIVIFPFFWVLIVVIGWLNSGSLLGTAVWSVVILISILIHEYGHALTAMAFGQTAEINLVGMGGLTKRDGPQLARWKEFLVVFNGPLAGFILFIIAYQILGHVSEKRSILIYALEVAIHVNVFWTLLNLLPVLPLDGGHLLRILLEGVFGLRGLKTAFFISIILAGLIGLYFFLSYHVLMGALFMMLAFESYRAWADVRSLTPEDSDQGLQNLIKEGLEELRAGRSQEALEKFSQVRQQAPKGVLYVTATQYAGRILAEQGNIKQAYMWLEPLQNRLSIDYLRLLQQIAYRLQEWEESVKIGEKAYQQEASIDTALINALSYAIMGKATPSIGWLHCAVQLGYKKASEIVQKREFDSIRDSEPFQKWIKNHQG